MIINHYEQICHILTDILMSADTISVINDYGCLTIFNGGIQIIGLESRQRQRWGAHYKLTNGFTSKVKTLCSVFWFETKCPPAWNYILQKNIYSAKYKVYGLNKEFLIDLQ